MVINEPSMKGNGAVCLQICRRMTDKQCRFLKINQKKAEGETQF